MNPVTNQPPIDQIVRKIAEELHPRRIVLFGSRARGEARPDSDVDLMIEHSTTLSPASRAAEVYRLLGLRKYGLDVLVYTPEEIREGRTRRYAFINVIEREGKVLYEQPG